MLAGGDVTLAVAFAPPTGQKLDHRWRRPDAADGVGSPPAALLREGAWHARRG